MKSLIVLILMTSIAFGYHEFQTPKKAYKKVTIEYFSNDKQKTSPDSTATIYYDKNDVEMCRLFKKGCGNVIKKPRPIVTRHPIGEIDPEFWIEYWEDNSGQTLELDTLYRDSSNFVHQYDGRNR